MRIAYLCDGRAECALRPMCIYREEPITASDDVCKRTLDPEHALNGPCENPEDHPERFRVIDHIEDESWYWEEDKKCRSTSL